MSSTILYLAIVAIWAGVLVPRWLRHEHHRDASSHSWQAAPPEGLADGADDVGAGAADVRPWSYGQGTGDDVEQWVRAPSRARVMAARRRLFCMLVLLVGAAAMIAAAGLAAWWVVAPPAAMFAGYVLVLREAARADAELRVHQRATPYERPVRWPAENAVTGPDVRATAGAAVGSAAGRVPDVGAGVSAGPGASAGGGRGADAHDIGTAHVVSIAARADQGLYDQYTDAKLRAVGD